MAAAAEVLERKETAFNWDLAEEQFTQDQLNGGTPVRSAESEIYGRSLGTICRLGAFMIGNSIKDAIESPEADQARIEFYTSVEEGFGTDMELGGGLEVRDFDSRPIIDGRVMSKDLKTAVSAMTESGLVCAKKTAKTDWRFKPQLIRSEWDHENALIVDRMARGETEYNTRIVVSPFPEEAAATSGDNYWRDIGYVPHLRRGFVQLYHASGSEVITGSLSFDGSNKKRLREVFSKHGIEIPEGEASDNWLKYAITATLNEDQAKQLATDIADEAGAHKTAKNTNTVDVTRAYGSIMDSVFNESYIHVCESLARGYQTEGATSLIRQLAHKAHNFNHRYTEALYKMRADTGHFTDSDSVVLHELLVYSTIEMMRALHLSKYRSYHTGVSTNRTTSFITPAQLQSMDTASFQGILSGFGAEGARSNRTYSACGLSISAGKDMNDIVDSLELSLTNFQAPFGGVTEKEMLSSTDEDQFGPLEFECTEGCKNRRPKGKLITECKNKTKGCKGSVGC